MLNKHTLTRLLLTVAASAVMFGCSNGGLREQPVELVDPLPSVVDLKVEWWRILDDEVDVNAFGHLNPTVRGDTIYVPVASGDVYELNSDGKVMHKQHLNEGITAPLVFSDEEVLVLTNNGEAQLYSLDYKPIWSSRLGAISIERPLITEYRIFVQTIDGRVNALERVTGRLLWAFQDAEPDLTITGTSAPVLVETDQGEAIVTGLSNGKVVALSVADGSVLWEYRIARASGSTDISRLVDVDAAATILDDRLIISGYQGDMVVIDVNTGRVLQALPFSSFRSIQSDGERWYGVNSQSHLVAFDPATMNELWNLQSFEYRQLSEVLIDDGYVFVADIKGYVHVVDAETGEWLTSRRIDWKGSNSDPIKYKDGILFQGRASRIKYLTVQPN